MFQLENTVAASLFKDNIIVNYSVSVADFPFHYVVSVNPSQFWNTKKLYSSISPIKQEVKFMKTKHGGSSKRNCCRTAKIHLTQNCLFAIYHVFSQYYTLTFKTLVVKCCHVMNRFRYRDTSLTNPAQGAKYALT